MTDSWHSYPKVWNLGHPSVASIFSEPVLVEEKVDGSQFSFGVFDGVLRCKSKSVEIIPGAPEGMFALAVKTADALLGSLREGWTYRAEYLMKPHHNGLAYDRVPRGNIILFDINDGLESYLPREAKEGEAERLGLEIVPCMAASVTKAEAVMAMLDAVSCLGGCKVEGLVFKNYSRFGADGKCLLAKYVREDFKEIQGKAWRVANPSTGDVVTTIAESLRTPARWEKAAQHLRERGALQSSPRDIPELMKEVQRDIEEECAEEIKAALYAHAKKQILRTSVDGLPEWWKRKLLEAQFDKGDRLEEYLKNHDRPQEREP
jgi:hypothetical protein